MLPAEAAPGQDGRTLYRLYETSHVTRQRFTLDLIAPGLTIDTLYYPYMLRVRYTPPRLLSLICFDCVFTLAGDSGGAAQLIRDHLVSEVHVFNARYHHAPLRTPPSSKKSPSNCAALPTRRPFTKHRSRLDGDQPRSSVQLSVHAAHLYLFVQCSRNLHHCLAHLCYDSAPGESRCCLRIRSGQNGL